MQTALVGVPIAHVHHLDESGAVDRLGAVLDDGQVTRGVGIHKLRRLVLAFKHVDFDEFGVNACDVTVETECARVSIQGEANDVDFTGVYAWDAAR